MSDNALRVALREVTEKLEAAVAAQVTAEVQLDGCIRRLDPVRESDSCVVDNIDRLNFEVSELKRTNQILQARLEAALSKITQGSEQ
jgi:FtsZ-binding cell division protein ZapB